MLSTPLISVIIPVFNPSEEICETIQSVLNQIYQNFEIIIVDDGSEIDVIPYINRFDDQRIMYYKLDHKNANVARNYGITCSKGKYIAMLDSDDFWLESHLEDCINTLQNAKADGVYGSLFLKYGNGYERPVYVRHLNEGEKMINYLLSAGVGAQTSTLFFTKESARDILWDETLARHQDYDFIVRYHRKYKLIPKTKPTVIYNCSNMAKSIDYQSCMRFIKNNIRDIKPQFYNDYNLKMLKSAIGNNASHDIIKQYQKEATRYPSYLSFDKYISIMNPKTWHKKLLCKLIYIFHLL